MLESTSEGSGFYPLDTAEGPLWAYLPQKVLTGIPSIPEILGPVLKNLPAQTPKGSRY